MTDPDSLLRQLRGLDRPRYEASFKRRWNEADRDAARAGRFLVWDRPTELHAPADWSLDGSRSFRVHLNALYWTDVLLQMAAEGDRLAFSQAVDLIVDWLDQNPPGDRKVAWNNKATGDRAAYVAYSLRLGGYEGWLAGDQATRLLDGALLHAEMLLDPAEYADTGNHGLFQDAGLLSLANYLTGVSEQTERWREVAVTRLKQNIKNRVSETDAVYLEHSVDYHMGTVNLLRRIRQRTPTFDAELEALECRLAETAGWFVTPAGRHAQIGDSHAKQAAAWALEAAEQARGLRAMFDAGYAAVRLDDSYLIVASSFHGPQHKQADELSFELYEAGLRIVGDPGKYRYQSDDPFRQFALSTQAHNTLLVDGVGWDILTAAPYGSGLTHAREHDGWYLLAGVNPLLAGQGVEHRRLFLYRPAEALVLIDHVVSEHVHDYTRLIHLGETIKAEGQAGRIALTGPGFSGSIEAFGSPAKVGFATGQEEPPQGWMFPSDSKKLPATTVAYTSRDRSAVYGLVIALRGGDCEVSLDSWSASAKRVLVRLDGATHDIVLSESP